ncbi:TlpA family protein disulfide reductase [Ilumatobacter sp.]|uniref:TlpA family protein disulfide reductase n=1 Tax=Ilumatobacter sp. TaxID=1967498 RepID=UPI003B51EAA4
MIAVAIDEDVERIGDYVRDETDGISYPVLIDAQHLLTELYAISNVPTVVLIDPDDTIVQPNWNAYATDTFKDYTGVDSGRQLDAIRRWVIDDEAMMTPDEARGAVGDLTGEEEQARLRFRIALRLRDDGDDEGAARNFDRAAELAPHDWTIRRAAMPLRGGDPFGPEFFELAEEHRAAGRPYHGVAAADRA